LFLTSNNVDDFNPVVLEISDHHFANLACRGSIDDGLNFGLLGQFEHGNHCEWADESGGSLLERDFGVNFNAVSSFANAIIRVGSILMIREDCNPLSNVLPADETTSIFFMK
jgi:hypothetical protein